MLSIDRRPMMMLSIDRRFLLLHTTMVAYVFIFFCSSNLQKSIWMAIPQYFPHRICSTFVVFRLPCVLIRFQGGMARSQVLKLYIQCCLKTHKQELLENAGIILSFFILQERHLNTK